MDIFSAARKFRRQVEFFHKFKLVDKTVLIICLSLNFGVLVAEALGFASLFPLMTFIEKGQSVTEFAKVSDLHASILDAHNALNLEMTLASLMLITFTFVTLRQSINYYAAVFNEHLKWRVGIDLGRLVVGNTLDSNSKYINKTDRGDFIVTCDYECQAVSTILSIHVMLFRASISFVAYVVLVLFASPGPALGSLLLFFVLSVAMGFLVKRAHQTGRTSVTVRREFVNTISEIYGAWKTIKLYNTEKFERDRYSHFGSRLTDVRVSLAKISGLIELIFVPAVLAVLLGMTFLMLEWLNWSVSVVLIYIATMVRLMPIAKDFQRRFAMLAQYDPSMSKVLNIIEEARSNFERRDDGYVFRDFKKNIELKNVSFRYDNAGSEVISGVNVFLPKGKVIAIVGPSGSGKSTLIDLIMGIIAPTNGQVLIDGIPLDSYSLASVRQNIAVVTQDTFLFNQSIRDNLCYGVTVSDDKLYTILRLLNLSDFVSLLPSGLDTTIADSGRNFSGGQKQRFAIARALIKDAPIIILDEPTSALDSLSEKEVIHIFKTMASKSKKTVIMVAHRKAAIEASDVVVNLLEHGVAVQSNTNNAKSRVKKS